MTHFTLSLGFIFFSFSLGAFELPDKNLGSYEILMGRTIAEGNRYLDCAVGETIEINSPKEQAFAVEGVTEGGPLEFENIDQGTIGHPQELMMYGEHRTYVEQSNFDFSVRSEHRSCSGLFNTSFGCFTMKWRQAKKIRFFKKTFNGKEGSYARLDYQPFADFPEEFCMLKKVADH